jgi:hypothetical protein
MNMPERITEEELRRAVKTPAAALRRNLGALGIN